MRLDLWIRSKLSVITAFTPSKRVPFAAQSREDPDGAIRQTKVKCRLDTVDEVEYFENDGILHYVLRRMKSDDNGGDQNVA